MTRISWQTALECTNAGPRPTLTNAVRVLQLDPALNHEHLWYDTFLDRVFVSNSPAREWTDEDDYQLTVYMQEQACILTISDGLVNKAVRMVAKQRPRHVVREWLETLTWDGEPRIAHAFEDHWGAQVNERQPFDYLRAASENFFIGLVARVFKPGCQLDTMVVFEGDQGIRKSSALRLLGGSWYGSAHESVQKKDFFEALRGKWVMEISELDAFGRAEVTRVKSVMSTPVDRYRPSYGRASADFPRQCVFVGTTNKDDWGNDETGLRRFWPVRCADIDLASLAAARDQLFAEAVAVFKSKSKWWEMPASAIDVQSDRQSRHPWTQAVSEWLVSQTEVSIADVLTNAIKKDTEKFSHRDQVDVGRILALEGWVKHNLKRNGKQVKMWKRISDTTQEYF